MTSATIARAGRPRLRRGRPAPGVRVVPGGCDVRGLARSVGRWVGVVRGRPGRAEWWSTVAGHGCHLLCWAGDVGRSAGAGAAARGAHAPGEAAVGSVYVAGSAAGGAGPSGHGVVTSFRELVGVGAARGTGRAARGLAPGGSGYTAAGMLLMAPARKRGETIPRGGGGHAATSRVSPVMASRRARAISSDTAGVTAFPVWRNRSLRVPRTM